MIDHRFIDHRPMIVGFFYSIFLLLSYLFLRTRILPYLLSHPSTWRLISNNIMYTLNRSELSNISMFIHFCGGFLVTSIGPIQIMPFLRTKRFLWLHQIFGQMYCSGCVMAALGGNVHILSEGTIGGLHMDIAFLLYGFLIFTFATITFLTATTIPHDKYEHRIWAIRTWSLGISPLVYRVVYAFLLLFLPIGRDFLHPVDLFMNYAFFLGPLAIAELYLRTFSLTHSSERIFDNKIIDE